MKRLLIYFLFDADGLVEDYVLYALRKLAPFMSDSLVVVNGKLKDEDRTQLQGLVGYVLERENIGFDVWAYKDALDHFGWIRLMEYDEVILMNYTIVGPVYDLSEMFDAMDKRDVDFWGITKCFREDSKAAVKMWGNPLGYIPEHIQSSFTAFRKSLVGSEPFQQMWNEMPMINSYYESGGTYEQVLTQRFADLGFKWDCYTNYSSIDPKLYGCCPLITEPLIVVRDLRSPFFKRRTFFTSKQEYPSMTPQVRMFWDFLKNDTDYDTSLIMNNFIRTCNQHDLVESLMLFHLLSENGEPPKANVRIAAFVNTENVVEPERLQQALAQLRPHVDVFLSQQSNLDLKSFCSGVNAFYTDYDYVLMIVLEPQEEHEDNHNYASRQNYYTFGMIERPGTFYSAIDLMEQEPDIGMLVLPTDYLTASNWERDESWASLYGITRKWMKRNNIKLPLQIDKPPVCPNGVCLLRTAALRGVERMSYRFFGSASMNYTLPLVCQKNGFLPHYGIPAQMMINNYFGFISYASWLPKTLEVKKIYYRSQMDYNASQQNYFKERNSYLEERNRFLEERVSQLEQQKTQQPKTLRSKLSSSFAGSIFRRLKGKP